MDDVPGCTWIYPQSITPVAVKIGDIMVKLDVTTLNPEQRRKI